jgi:hypothetical protein
MSLASMCRSALFMQRQTVSQDSSGGSLRAWANVETAPIRGDIQPASGAVQMRFMQQELIVSHTLYLVRDPGATPDCRFQTADGTRTFLFRGRLPPGAGYKQWPCVIHVEEIL